MVFTVSALYALDRDFYPPHGNPLVYALAMSWLISFAVAMLTAAIFSAYPKLFSLAGWENDGKVYDQMRVGAFRRILRHSPLGWINPNLHLSAGRADCERLLKELSAAEGVHWLTFVASSILAIWCLADGYVVYGSVMLLVRIPFDLYPIMLQRRNRGRLLRLMSAAASTRPGTSSWP